MEHIAYLGSDESAEYDTIEDVQNSIFFDDRWEIMSLYEFCNRFNDETISDLGYIFHVSVDDEGNVTGILS